MTSSTINSDIARSILACWDIRCSNSIDTRNLKNPRETYAATNVDEWVTHLIFQLVEQLSSEGQTLMLRTLLECIERYEKGKKHETEQCPVSSPLSLPQE